jgi:hypothetical protein
MNVHVYVSVTRIEKVRALIGSSHVVANSLQTSMTTLDQAPIVAAAKFLTSKISSY